MTHSDCYKILVVDDEEAMLRSYQSVLSGVGSSNHKMALKDLEADLFRMPVEPAPVGFEITARLQGADAVSVIRQTAREPKFRRYAVAFIDVRMPPGINGVDAARQMHEIDPEMMIVFVTGYSDFSVRQIVSGFPPEARIFFVRKPFSADEILGLARMLSKEWAGVEAIDGDEAEIRRRFDMRQVAAA